MKRILTLLACALLLLPAALAYGDEVTEPACASVAISLPQMDMDSMIAALYGDQAEALELESQVYEYGGVSVEVTSGALPDCEYAFSCSGNYVNMQRYHAIPLSYRSEGEGAYLPPPSDIAGKYTEAEAIELARQFIQDELGIAKHTGVIVTKVQPEDPAKPRSRAYVIEFAYAWEGIPLRGTTQQLPQVTPMLTVGVTDEGIVSFAGDILELSSGRQSEAPVLPLDEVARLNPNDWLLAQEADLRLCYMVGPAHEGRLAWCAADLDGSHGYDAYTGERLA